MTILAVPEAPSAAEPEPAARRPVRPRRKLVLHLAVVALMIIWVTPTLGLIDKTVSVGTKYVNPRVNVAIEPSGFVTTTSRGCVACSDAGPIGVLAVIDAELTKLTSMAGMPPIVTVAPV